MYRKWVSALILNKNEEFILVNLKSFKNIYFAVPGGWINDWETLENAVYREIFEELWIKKESLILVGKTDVPLRFKFKEIELTRDGRKYGGSERYFFGFRFLGKDSEIKPQDDEVRTYKWVPYVDLSSYLLFDNQLKETSDKIIEIFPYLSK